jgi:3-methyladenine DNA glycosylase AlkC
MFEIITHLHKTGIVEFVNNVKTSDTTGIVDDLSEIIEHIHADIPEKNRISYGRYSIITKLGVFIYPLLKQRNIPIKDLAINIFNAQTNDPFIRSLGIQFLSLYGQDTGELETVLSVFEKASMDEQWIVRECSAGFVRKLTKKYPETMHPWYFKMAKSSNTMQRRFAVESLRPVADNGWFKKIPTFAFSILELLYKESEEYARTSVGNSLSDWMRIDEATTFEVVKTLALNGDKNSYWIAYRACRNLVKKNPLLVMDTLKIDYYKYKDRTFYRKDCVHP